MAHFLVNIQSQLYVVILRCQYDLTHLSNFLRNQSDDVLDGHFHPNPDHSSVVRGGEAAHCEDCDSIIAAGGGSAIGSEANPALRNPAERHPEYRSLQTS